MISKKAQGLSINVIVIAAIMVVVLIVVILIFVNHIGHFSKTTKNCKVLGGECMDASECKSAVIDADCGGSVNQVINNIHWFTVGGKAVCCMNI